MIGDKGYRDVIVYFLTNGAVDEAHGSVQLLMRSDANLTELSLDFGHNFRFSDRRPRVSLVPRHALTICPQITVRAYAGQNPANHPSQS